MTRAFSTDLEVQNLIDLISNTLDAYTTALFLAPTSEDPLRLHAFQSLSLNINEDVVIGPGDGLIGWVFKYEKPVSVDQFDRDTRRLLFYKTDESIKSFMAVPLPLIQGVLAVDSKKQYVFSEKSHKLLHQFGQTLELMIQRGNQALEGLRLNEAMSFFTQLEEILADTRRADDSRKEGLRLIRKYADVSASFLTAINPVDPDRFFVLSFDSDLDMDLDPDPLPLDQGLAGWVMAKGRMLNLDRARTDPERSFIFYPDEPLGRLEGFAGFPAMFGNLTKGALILAGEIPRTLDPTKNLALKLAANRLAANVEQEILYQRIGELNRLDPQIGLPHRTDFADRLRRLMTRDEAQTSGLSLAVFHILNLDHLAWAGGQIAVRDVLRSAARVLLAHTPRESELGVIDFGNIALGLAGVSAEACDRICMDLSSRLVNRPLSESQGQIRIGVKVVQARYPAEASRAEELILLGLAKLENQGG